MKCFVLACTFSFCTMCAASAQDIVFRDAATVREGDRYADVVHADFAAEAYPSRIMDMLRIMPKLQSLVVAGPRYTDAHLVRLAKLKSLKQLILDSTDITDAAIESVGRDRPDLSIHRSQYWAARSIGSLSKEIVVESKRADDWDEPEVVRLRSLYGGGHFMKVTAVDFSPLLKSDNAPGDPIQNEELIGLKYLTAIENVDLSYCRINDSGINYLKPLVKVRSLRLPLKEVSEQGLTALRGMKELESFTGAFDDDTIRRVSQFPALNNLVIDPIGSSLTDAGLKHIGELRQLTFLRLSRTKVRGHGLKHLAGIATLSHLNLDETPLDDLSAVSLIPGLTTLRIGKTRVTDGALAHLSQCRRLETLWLNDTEISDAGVANLSKLPNLRDLNLSGTKVTDACFKHLQSIPSLERVYLRQTRVSLDLAAKALGKKVK